MGRAGGNAGAFLSGQDFDRQAAGRVTAAIVTYNSAAAVGPCLGALAGRLPVVVVDNASSDGSREAVRHSCPQADIVANRVNEGFGRACNRAFARARTEFVLLINPDAVIDLASVARLVAAADRYPGAGILAPAIASADGLIANFDWALFDPSRRRGRLPAEMQPAGDICAGFLSGAVMLLRAEALRKLGGFDSSIFLFYEDDDICMRFRRAGYALVLVPDAEARHSGGQSSAVTEEVRRRKHWHQAWSRLYLESKYRGAGAARRLGARVVARHALKSLGYRLVLNGAKARRDAAQCAGSIAFLAGRPAVPAEAAPSALLEAAPGRNEEGDAPRNLP